jgi:hypothetical protein
MGPRKHRAVWRRCRQHYGSSRSSLLLIETDSHTQLWRQSQGAILSHLYILAFPETPLAVKFGVIPLGASATLDLETAGDVYQDFNIVA